MDLRDHHIAMLKAELKGLRWAFAQLWAEHVRLNNKYRRKKLKEYETMPNFTKKYFDTREELDQFLEENKELFRFVTYSCGQQSDGRWLIVY